MRTPCTRPIPASGVRGTAFGRKPKTPVLQDVRPCASSRVATYDECDSCHKEIGEDGKVRRRDGLVLTALCASCLAAGVSLRLSDDPHERRRNGEAMTAHKGTGGS